ncbi:anti-sigma factor [Sporosarcina pasteurii]|uniref:Anti-sigma-W factor RsiW n=1 Tax=Sporosarcina pasteurii TaxID=1474 RepID=A0A380CJZ4_SPOPA|nr:anti-sigma factor [Sporosarcina pasteurii]MDS9472048.1 anti-sigma factor [Sporosarcina pasteurii]QBQ06776.1 anti-sigma factor [Sporosarcina pasteurii]SUJ20928.1 Anti-sigma-W factor rsiW [Sporosarcina pasteurii]
MNTCPEQIVHYMHAYLDGDISRDDERVLNEHLKQCTSCQELMDDLTDVVQFIEKADPIQAPSGFVDGVMARLPKEKSQAGIQRWLRRHPLLAAVAMFFILMSVSVFSSYGNDQQFSVTKQPNLIVEGETVTVPEGEVVKGDVVVKNGELHVEGEVDGNVTVIRGSKYMASTAIVTGTSQEIDKAFDWLWYKIKKTFKDVFQPSDDE